LRFQSRFHRGGTRFAWADRESKAPLDHIEAGLAGLALVLISLLIDNQSFQRGFLLIRGESFQGSLLPVGALAVSVATLCVVVLARAGYTRFTAGRG
jgi:hypothetical protein